MERGGVNAQTTAYHGNNALTLLWSYSDDKDMVGMARLLITEKKLNVNHLNKSRDHALLCLFGNKAASGGEKQLEVARLLIANGCDIKVNKGNKEKKAKNVLHYLFLSKRNDQFTIDMTRVLIEAVSVKGKDSDGMLKLVCKNYTGERQCSVRNANV